MESDTIGAVGAVEVIGAVGRRFFSKCFSFPFRAKSQQPHSHTFTRHS
ncbi:MAG: hypothetical protein LBV28_05515 [Puniceicoccales bacterium]|nr:hypothetical protein [Puniceicoccales bacterium]